MASMFAWIQEGDEVDPGRIDHRPHREHAEEPENAGEDQEVDAVLAAEAGLLADKLLIAGAVSGDGLAEL